MLLGVLASLLSILLLQQSTPLAASPLDYDVFKSRVQPIFLAKRPGHARCYTCHSGGGYAYLQKLAPGAAMWDDEQTRRNFDAVRRYVTAGEPDKSRLLMHPLDEHAGGDEFHAGGKHWTSRDNPEWQALAAWVRGRTGRDASDIPAPSTSRSSSYMAITSSPSGAVRVVQTNSAGDSVHLIDPGTNRVVAEIKDIEVNHGVAAAPDGRRLYITDEAENALDVVDVRTLKVAKRIPLSGHPNNLSISRDGRRVYIAISQAPGAVDVVDTASQTRVKSIPIEGAGHNTFVTPDGKFVVAGSVAGRTLTVIDTRTDEPAWAMRFEGGVRPMAFETNADGSTGRMFVQISDFHGFVVIDFATHKEISRVTLPDPPGVQKNTSGIQGSPSHGIGIAPDGKTLWATSKWYHYVAAYSMPGLEPLGIAQVGHHPDWLTFSPDSKTVYVACAGSNAVSVVDVRSITEVARIPVGQVPKRNITAVLQLRD